MVLSSEHDPYDKFMQAQQQTWDSVPHPFVDVVYYYCGGRGINKNVMNGPKLNRSTELSVECSTDYYKMHWKFKKALDIVNYGQYDYIFRTNASSYIDKQALYEYAKKLPKHRLYAGWLLGWLNKYVEFEGRKIRELCISGAGIWFSFDSLGLLHRDIREDHNKKIEDDVLFGRIMLTHGIQPINIRQMISLTGVEDYIPGSYHYRLKTNDREKDIETMYWLHDKIRKL